ncbi:MAG: LysR family transcriptional regulator [Propionibacteriaceae bacterium]|jgi:DNA-binding transcriptional LysR family regulator|nr:LysR family transcriptional regulator [Propionibacteriaceae bacterium]
MDLNPLRYFQFVALYRNFSRAAEHFYISQSALSRQIAGLEADLGVQLFERDTRSVSLTDAGRVLYERCDLLLTHYDTILELTKAAGQGAAGTLTIAVIASFRHVYLDLVGEFRRRFPGVETVTEEIAFDALSDAVANGVYDVAFTLDFMVPYHEQLESVEVMRDRMVVAAPAALGLPGKVKPVDLLPHPVIMNRHGVPPILRRLRVAAAERGGSASGSVTLVPNTPSALLQVSLGRGLNLLPKQVLEHYGDVPHITVSEIDDSEAACAFVLVRRKDRESKTIDNFVALVREQRRLGRLGR